jgi:hypothetical protein
MEFVIVSSLQGFVTFGGIAAPNIRMSANRESAAIFAFSGPPRRKLRLTPFLPGLLAAMLVPALCAQTPTMGRVRTGRTRQPQTGISDLETPAATFHGTVRSISKQEIVLDLPEDQSVAFHISRKTKFVKEAKPIKPTEIAAGAPVTIDGKRDARGNTEAVTVTVDTKPAARPDPAKPS